MTQLQTLRETDVFIVATKVHDTEKALAALQELKTNAAFSVQNGVLKNELLGNVLEHTLHSVRSV